MCTVLFLFSEVVSTEYMGIVLVKQSSQTRLKKGRCWIVSWGSHTPCFLISVPPIKTELMCLLLGIIRPQQICWKSEQKDKKGLSFGELSLSERLMYSPSNPIFFNFANLHSLRTKGLFLYYSVFNIESINVDLDGQLPCRATEKAQDRKSVV